jgi:Tfp pilus assembly protein FimT
VFFDAPGRSRITKADGSIAFEDPGPAAKKNLQTLMQAGTPIALRPGGTN